MTDCPYEQNTYMQNSPTNLTAGELRQLSKADFNKWAKKFRKEVVHAWDVLRTAGRGCWLRTGRPFGWEPERSQGQAKRVNFQGSAVSRVAAVYSQRPFGSHPLWFRRGLTAADHVPGPRHPQRLTRSGRRSRRHGAPQSGSASLLTAPKRTPSARAADPRK